MNGGASMVARSPESGNVPPQHALRHLIFAYRDTAAVATAARLGIADHLAGGPKAVDELAALVGARPATLFRLLRALVGLGVLAQLADGRFDLTPVGAGLRGDVRGSLRPAALLFGGEHWQ